MPVGICSLREESLALVAMRIGVQRRGAGGEVPNHTAGRLFPAVAYRGLDNYSPVQAWSVPRGD